MTITLKINEFLYELFPGTENDTEKLINTISRFYAVGPFKPTVTVEEDFIHIEIDVARIQADKQKFDKLVSLAERGEFDQAKKFAADLIKDAPHISEYHRILGQIYSETGDQDEAINTLIDALKWNPKNENALLMVGNIYANYKDDADTALDYYEQVLALNPDDHLALNNIGVKLMEAGKLKQAKQYLELSEEIEPEYPNTLHALAMLHEMQGELSDAFDYSVKSLKHQTKTNTPLYKKSVEFILDVADRLTTKLDSRSVVDSFIKELEVKTDVDIKVREDDDLDTAATIQYAEVHSRDHHLILIKPDHPAVDHLMLHELMHLELAHEARQAGQQESFTHKEANKSSFMRQFNKDAEKLINKGIPEHQVNRLMNSLFRGLNGQIFNAPLDLFIEDRIYNRFPDLRPLQLLSVFSLIKVGIEANTKPDILKITPSKVLSASIIYNLVGALHFKNLFGLDMIAAHKPKKSELEKAQTFYQEYQNYRGDKNPGEEYDLIQFWANDLKLDNFFELIPEESKKHTTADSVLDNIENDPYGLDIEDPVAERKMKQFMEHHGDADVNQAVAMYMVSALQYFKDMPKEEVKKIAMDIATVGMTGIDPEKDGYHIPSIEGSSFSGYQTLAYYYVSWAIAIPEMLPQLQMSFDKEYELAINLFKNN